MASHVDPDQNLGFALKRVQLALRARMDEGLARHGLTAPQYAVLALLERAPGSSNAELARASFVAPPTMIHVVARLAAEGLVERDDPASGRRSRGTVLTPAGHARLAAAAAHVQQVEDTLAAGLDEAGLAVVRGWLHDCAERLTAAGAPR